MSTTNSPPVAGLCGAAMLPLAEPVTAPSPAARKQSGGRFAEINGFIDFTLASLTRSEVAVWLVLFRDIKAKQGTAQTGQSDIARRAGITPRGVRKALAGLIVKGLVRVVRQGRIGVGTSVYRIRGMNPNGGK